MILLFKWPLWRRCKFHLGISYRAVSQRICMYSGNLGSVSGLGRSPGGRAWHPTPVLPGESRLQSMGLQRVRHD